MAGLGSHAICAALRTSLRMLHSTASQRFAQEATSRLVMGRARLRIGERRPSRALRWSVIAAELLCCRMIRIRLPQVAWNRRYGLHVLAHECLATLALVVILGLVSRLGRSRPVTRFVPWAQEAEAVARPRESTAGFASIHVATSLRGRAPGADDAWRLQHRRALAPGESLRRELTIERNPICLQPSRPQPNSDGRHQSELVERHVRSWSVARRLDRVATYAHAARGLATTGAATMERRQPGASWDDRPGLAFARSASERGAGRSLAPVRQWTPRQPQRGEAACLTSADSMHCAWRSSSCPRDGATTA